jgi:acyl carrier protein
MDLEAIIAQEVRKQAAAAAGGTATVELDRDTPLIDTGLDSLGFTTLVIDLERQLGVDPFGGDTEIVYPETFGELVDLYVSARGQ